MEQPNLDGLSRTFMFGVTGFAFVILTFFSGCQPVKTAKDGLDRPNILLILADDLGYSDIGSFGGEIATPNLDRLATNGIRFVQMHNTSKCFPSRACLLTGLYAQQVGYDKNFKTPLANATTLGAVMKSAGYRTLFSGKHHGVENPFTFGFDRYYGLIDGACNHFNPGVQREGEGKPAQKKADRLWGIDSISYQPYNPPKDFYTTDYFTKYALDWLEDYRNEEQPFFLYLAYTAPHDPLMAWPEDIEKYRGKYDAGYEEIRKRRFEKQQLNGLISDTVQLSQPTHRSWDSLSDEEKEEESMKMTVYAAMIDRLDQNIGKVLSKLDSLGKLENTLVIFLSDNGSSAEVVKLDGSGEIGTLTRWTSLGEDWANVSNTPLRFFKNYSYEGGICTPMIASWPEGIKEPGRISDFTGHFIDIMPTMMEVAEASYPAEYKGHPILPLQGESLVPVFRGETKDREKPLFWSWRRGKAVRQGEWKAVWQGEVQDEWALFNLTNDPAEMNDLSSEYKEKLLELVVLFQQWETEMKRVDFSREL